MCIWTSWMTHDRKLRKVGCILTMQKYETAVHAAQKIEPVLIERTWTLNQDRYIGANWAGKTKVPMHQWGRKEISNSILLQTSSSDFENQIPMFQLCFTAFIRGKRCCCKTEHPHRLSFCYSGLPVFSAIMTSASLPPMRHRLCLPVSLPKGSK